MPLWWAAGQNNLGNALSSLGQREPGTQSLELAADAYRGALEEWTRERDPYDWATAHNNLGHTLVITGQRSGNDSTIEAGIASYQEALKEWTRQSAPLQWASLQGGLGIALLGLGRDRADEKLLRDARQATQLAWTFYREAGYPQFETSFRDRMAEIDQALASLK